MGCHLEISRNFSRETSSPRGFLHQKDPEAISVQKTDDKHYLSAPFTIFSPNLI